MGQLSSFRHEPIARVHLSVQFKRNDARCRDSRDTSGSDKRSLHQLKTATRTSLPIPSRKVKTKCLASITSGFHCWICRVTTASMNSCSPWERAPCVANVHVCHMYRTCGPLLFHRRHMVSRPKCAWGWAATPYFHGFFLELHVLVRRLDTWDCFRVQALTWGRHRQDVTSSPVHLCHVLLCHHCTCVDFRRALESQAKRGLHTCHHIGLH